MGSEIFRLKSLYMEDTVVRGARINVKNSKNTQTVLVNPGDNPVLKTGETGINTEFLIQASLISNDLKGYGTFTNNSDVVRGYTGPQNVHHGDIIRLDTDIRFYNVTGIQGTGIFLVEKYSKTNASDPDVQAGAATVRKIKLDSVQYESARNPDPEKHIYYDKDNTNWGITGINFSDPEVAPSTPVSFETGMTLQFKKGASAKGADLLTIGSVYKTIVDNNTNPISDLSLSPLPYPHESLKVYAGPSSGRISLQVENENYVVNYSQSPEYKFPRPPYQERPVAYIKFLDKLTEETQIEHIDGIFEGNLAIQKRTATPGGVDLVRPVRDIIPTSSFVMKVADADKRTYTDYIPDYGAGLVNFVKHRNSERLIGAVSYVQRLMWDGVSVIKGVGEDQVKDFANLVIPGVTGLPGVTGVAYYEDTNQNNFIRDIDYTLDPESGSIRFTAPLKESESVLVSYYVEGEDVADEKILLNDMRVNKFPIITNTVTLTMRYKVQEDNQEITKTKVLIEGEDYTLSYITGKLSLTSVDSDQQIVSLEMSYTPMAAINCILQTIPGDSLNYKIRIVDDVVKVSDPEKFAFQANNPLISIPQKKIFKDEVTTSNYDFLSPIIPDSLICVKNERTGESYDVTGYSYTDVSRELKLDDTLNGSKPDIDDTVVATYSFESERLPYAPLLVINTIFNQGDSSFVIEGFDRTDVLKAGMTLQVNNFDPENIYYFKIKSVTYSRGNTVVSLYGSFAETIINPTFFLLDDEISWQNLPSGAVVDTSTPIQSDSIIINGSPLQIRQNIKKDTLLMVNGQQIYTVTAVTVASTQSVIGIYPPLQSSISGSVQYSNLPIHLSGDDVLNPQYFALIEPTEPAFTLSYKAPEGFEGSAKILIDNNKIVLVEAIRGVVNPDAYVFEIANYGNLYDLAKAIQGTRSTFPVNVPLLNVPDYNPFTIAPNGSTEDYYLAPGSYSTDLIVPFEQDLLVDLPYTVQITPELFKWTLLQAYAEQPSLEIKKADRTGSFLQGNLLAFRNKFDGKVYFYEVEKSELVDNEDDASAKNTLVTLKDQFRVNLLDPSVYKYDNVSWQIGSNQITNINSDNSEITFEGSPEGNIRAGTVIKFGDQYVYQVSAMSESASDYTLTLVPDIDSNVRAQTYHGYVKYSSVPIYLNEVGPQPFLSIQYTPPTAHTGVASIKVDSEGIYLKETVDNFHERNTTLPFSAYENFIDLVEAINSTESYVDGFTPFAAAVPATYVEALSQDNFSVYRLRTTNEQYVSLPNVLMIAASAFEISYTPPSVYSGSATVEVKQNEIVLTETVVGYNNGEDATNVVRVRYSDTQSLYQLATDVIPGIPSLVAGGGTPYSCVLANESLFRKGLWNVTHIAVMDSDPQSAPAKVYGIVDGAYWYGLGPLNERRLVRGTDYEIETGAIALTTPIVPLDRYRLNYMGLWNLAEYEGSSIKCSCRYFTELAAGSRVDVYMDYLNIDQFYLQKLTERKFTETVVVPQIQELVDQKGSGGGQGSDNGANSNGVPNYQGGAVDLYYALRDEEIKKQLYLRFYRWYKERLRDFSAELQLTMGFKFGHSNALGLDSSDNYSLEDQYVENEDYTLTSEADLKQINNGFSKFYPVGYEGQAPMYYPRFGTEYRAYNDVYCCNIQYRDNGNIVKRGIVKSDNPYWNRDLNFLVWSDDAVNAGKGLVPPYEVDVPAADRTIDADTFTFLKKIDAGDKIRATQFNNYYEIAEIKSPTDTSKTYDYLVLSSPITEKGVKTYVLNDVNPAKELKDENGVSVSSYTSFESFLETLPPDGFQIYVKRQAKEPFPMADDYGNLGASAYGENIEGLVRNTRRIKKPFLKALLRLLFPLASTALTPHKNFKIWAKKDSESDWESLGQIDLKKLTFKEERNADDVLDALRYDFKEVFTVPGIPPVPSITIYDIDEDEAKGFHRYFYMSMERIYDADSPGGYYDGFVLRARNKEWWFRITNGDGMAIIDDYGFASSKVYKNFYDPDNIYKKMLLEKQAWETEALILKDLYDYSDKIARAFDQGDLNRKNSKYQGYLAKPTGGATNGISDILMTRIPAYEKQLLFLINSRGPVYELLYPDFVHPEDSASAAIALTFSQTQEAWGIYNGAYQKEQFFKALNNQNNITWRNDYVRWALSLEHGLIYQGDARTMTTENGGTFTVGLRELPALSVGLAANSVYTVESPTVTVTWDNNGKIIRITVTLNGIANPTFRVENLSIDFHLYNENGTYKTLTEMCDLISSYRYLEGDPPLFTCSRTFEHYENNVTPYMLAVAGLPIDPVSGATLYVTSVADARSSDPRVLFLNRGIEDRVYTQTERELPGFTIKYNGEYYTQSLDPAAITVVGSSAFVNLSFGTFLNTNYKKIFVLQGSIITQGVLPQEIDVTFDLFDSATNSYKTLQQLVAAINAYTVSNSPIFSATVNYSDPTLSTETLRLCDDFLSATRVSNGWRCTAYAHTDTSLDAIDSEINQGICRIFYDANFMKKLEIKFSEVIVDGTVIRTNSGQTSTTFVFDFQNSDKSYKTLQQFVDQINSYVYKQQLLFEATAIYQGTEGSALSTRYVVVDNLERSLGFDLSTDIYVDTYVENISPTSAHSLSSVRNAYFAHPMYTANGNPRKAPIEGIPVSGRWDITENEPVLRIRCLNGTEWELSYNDYDSGSYKSYTPVQIVDLIDTQGFITEAQYNTIALQEDQPVVSMIKEMVLTRKSTLGDTQFKINLRQYDTIQKVVDQINSLTITDPATGTKSNVFIATLVGEESVQGEYKSYELDASYVPIVRSFYVTYESDGQVVRTVPKVNFPVGWRISSQLLTSSDTTTLVMSAKRYSTGDAYNFTINPPNVAYRDTLLNNPQGFRRDTLAFDIYCWDDEGYYEIKDNWIYFRSLNVGYAFDTDKGQPDKNIGYGIPLAGSGHPQAVSTESLASLVNRINSDSAVNKWFYANLKFTRSDNVEPGFFQYDYLPNFRLDVPKSTLDRIYLRDDDVISLRPNTGYTFTTSSYQVNRTAQTLDLSCDWVYNYSYSKTYDLTSASYDTIGELASGINIDLAPNILSSIFEANVVAPHSSDSSVSLLSNSGAVQEITETATVDVLNDYINVTRSDWYVDDIVTFTTTGTLPSPLATATNYYVVSKTGTGTNILLRVSTTLGGPAINILNTGSGVHTIRRKYVDLLVNPLSVVQPALQIKVRNLSGSDFLISNAAYQINSARTQLVLSCTIRYSNSFTIATQDISGFTVSQLAAFINSLYDYDLPALFSSQTVNAFYDDIAASRMLSAFGQINSATTLQASLGDIEAIRLLNMNNQANVSVFPSAFQAVSTDTVDFNIPFDKNLHSWVDDVLRGDYKQGLISIDILPIKVPEVSFGRPAIMAQTQLTSGNQPAHVYFGILGDIHWVQISDQNLHTQLNYVKERLGMPWKDDQGTVVLDYYTPERYDINNPYAIDKANFLGYMRTTRYNQIRNSVINEAVVQNKYFWLYMKFHKEFGCDQRVLAIKKQISQKETDMDTLSNLD